jgi:hypothetical protein
MNSQKFAQNVDKSALIPIVGLVIGVLILILRP